MSDISSRRRLAGRAAIAATFLAVPLTASIAYADTMSDDIQSVPAAPAPPAPPSVSGEPPAPPAPPAPPEVEVEVEETQVKWSEIERELDEAREEIIEIERELAEDGKERRIVRREVHLDGKRWEGMSDEDRENLRKEMAKLREQFSEDGEMRREIRMAFIEAQRAGADAADRAPRVVMKCKDKENLITTEEGDDGKVVMFVCEANADKLAMSALKSARSAIASERNLTDEQRAEALRAIDEEMAELRSSK